MTTFQAAPKKLNTIAKIWREVKRPFDRAFRKQRKYTSYAKTFYSQDGEDAVLSTFYEGKEDHKGFYVDIGALHPLRFSNTQYFYERGWCGINIDATPRSMDLFNQLRPNDINVEIGIADQKGEMIYYSFEEPALNSFSKKVSDERIEKGWRLKEAISVETDTINAILEKHLPANQSIDFINIDIEGLELSILRQFDFDKYRPEYFLIEELDYANRDMTECVNSPIYKVLSSEGYVPIAKTLRTVIYKSMNGERNETI